jgi:uncharacterized membrane protein (DUF106 family)
MNGIIEVMLYTIGLSFVMAVIYRKLTNPEEMRKLKADMKDLNDRIKKAQKSNNTKEVSDLTSELLKGSSKQFQSSMKPMMVSSILFLLFIGWIGAAYGSVTFDITESSMVIEGYEGQVYEGVINNGEGLDFVMIDIDVESGEDPRRVHIIDLDGDGDYTNEVPHITVKRPGILGASWQHEGNDVYIIGQNAWGNPQTDDNTEEQKTAFSMFVQTPFQLPVFGQFLSWIWWYIIIIVPSSFLFRKLLGVE